MTLTDAGPLVSLLDRGEADHARCVRALSALSPPLLTTWPTLTEAMYLLGQIGGHRGQDALWDLLERGSLEVAELDPSCRRRARELMKKYRDLPMDLADATLVAVAEARGLRRVFTLDADFQVYRLQGRHHIDLVPE